MNALTIFQNEPMMSHITDSLAHTFNNNFPGGSLIHHKNGTWETIPKSIPYVFGERVIAPILEAGSQAIKSIDRVFSRLVSFPPGARADDVGLIAWFDKECPEGWQDYEPLNGRVALGASEQSTRIGVDTTRMESMTIGHLWSRTDLRFMNCANSEKHLCKYLNLKPCKKIKKDNYVSKEEMDSLKQEFSNPQVDLSLLKSKLEDQQSTLEKVLAFLGTSIVGFGTYFFYRWFKKPDVKQ